MKSFFSKKPKSNSANEEDQDSEFNDSQPPSPTKSPTKSSHSRSPSKKFQQRPDSPSASPSGRESKSQQQQQQQSAQSQPRSSRPFTRHPTDPGQSSRRKKVDPDTHPLNLPPQQRQRFSEMSGASARNSMDHDKEPVINGGKPSSPPPQQKPSAPTHSNSFTVPITNGTADAKTNGDKDVPAPPPHRSQPSSPTQTAAEDAEKVKNEGNKYFGEKNYSRAIQLYTKGEYLFD